MSDLFVRDETYTGPSAEQPNAIDLERQSKGRSPECAKIDSKAQRPMNSQDSGVVPESSYWNMKPSINTVRKVVLTVVVVVLPITVWHYGTGFLTGSGGMRA